MCFLAVSVKWQKEVFPDVEINTSLPPYVFKCQLFDLTGVPPERQKIMVKGGLLKVLRNYANLSEYLCSNIPYEILLFMLFHLLKICSLSVDNKDVNLLT